MAIFAPTVAQPKKKAGLPFPPTPYAGAAPISTSAPIVAPTQTPTTVQDAFKNTNATVDQAKGSVAATQPFLDTYLKPNAAGTTPFRQALTNTKASDTAAAYDNAVSAARNRAVAAGFSSNSQPVTFGAETGLANERAKAIADIPNKVNIEAQPIETQAAQLQQQQGGIYNALANTQQSEANTLLEQERIAAQEKAAKDAQKAALAGGIAQTAIGVGAPIIKAALAKTAAPVAGAVGAAGVGGGGALGGGAVGLGGIAPSVEGTAAAGSATAGGGGLGASLGALASNPITWAVAGAITAAIVWHKSQVHPTATTFVRDYQDVFANDKGTGHLNKVVDGYNQAMATGQLDKAHAQMMRNETAALIEQFKQDTNAFAQKGSHENQVAHQAKDTMARLFGPNWEGILGKMDAEIAGLA